MSITVHGARRASFLALSLSRFRSPEERIGVVGFALMLLLAMSHPLWAHGYKAGDIDVGTLARTLGTTEYHLRRMFSSLAGITEMSTTLKAIADKLGSTGLSDALGYVGRAVLVEGATNYPLTDGSIAGAIELDGAANDVRVTITDASGAVLKTVSLGAQKPGIIDYTSDGTTDSGDPAGDGPFTGNVTAAAGANTVPARSLIWAPVQSVSMSNGQPTLSIPGLGQVPATAVRKVG